MKSYLSFAILAIALFTASCSKNNDDTENNVPATTTRLQRYVVLDAADTLLKCSYTYDSQKRIAESHKLFYETGAPSYDIVAVFNYNGNDTLHSRIDYRFVDISGGSPDETYTEYFTYDGTGRITQDSIHYVSAGSRGYHFSYLADHFRVTTSFQDTVDCYQTRVNGNLITETDTVFGPGTTDFSVDIHNSFDNHPNPFYYTEIRRTLDYMPENYLQDEELPAFTNNPLSMSSMATGTPTNAEQTSFTYTYNTDGYPVTAAIHDLINNDHFTAYYFY